MHFRCVFIKIVLLFKVYALGVGMLKLSVKFTYTE